MDKGKPMEQHLAANLRAQRKRRGMTQQALADAAGISKPYVANIEAGRRVPPLETLRPIAQALGVTLNELMAPAPRAADGEP